MQPVLRSILVPVDLAPGTDRVIGRAALLPLADDARIHLLHVVPQRLPRRLAQTARPEAEASLRAWAERLEQALRGGARVEVVTTVGKPAAEIGRRARAVKADLIVSGRGSARAVRDAFLGSTAERVMRIGRCPVLAVRRRPRVPYRRPLLALDLDDAARRALSVALRILPPPRPVLTLIHAYDPPYRGLVYSSLESEEAAAYRQEALAEVRGRIAEFLAEALGQAVADDEVTDRPVTWRSHVRYGSPRTVIRKAVDKHRADLLVMGSHGHAGVTHAFLGTVAGDLLREVSCDVLVVPP